MRWASKLSDDSNVLSLLRSLPDEVVEEQVRLYRKRDELIVAGSTQGVEKIQLPSNPRHHVRMKVAERFHMFCRNRSIDPGCRLPYGTIKAFREEALHLEGTRNPVQATQLRRWYNVWRISTSQVMVAESGQATSHHAEKSLLRSRAPKQIGARQRAPGGGPKFAAPLIRQALFEWWSSIRHAIDWKQLIAENRSRGRKKALARFPRSVLLLKLNQLLEEHAHACLLNGKPVQSFTPNSHWWRRWEDEYGLSMRAANRKYQVPRHVLKERLEIFWVNLFRLRLFIRLQFGYDPLLLNFDQSPFHHNETGAQNKATLGVRGSVVPVVEGNSDIRSRWTANLTTVSRFFFRSRG